MNPISRLRSFCTSALLSISALAVLPGWSSSAAIAAGACAIGEGRWGGGFPTNGERWSDLSEDLLLVGAGAELIVFDIITPTAPVDLGRVTVNHPIEEVDVSADGSMVAVGDRFDNVTLIDISIRESPVVRGTFAWPGIQQPRGATFDGDYLYVAVRTIGVSVLDISDPDAPLFVANSDVAATDFALDVAIRGDYAYVGQSGDGIQIVDISDPNTPTVIGSVAGSVGASLINIDGNRAYVARGGNGFSIFDLSNPTVPVEIGGLVTGGGVADTALLPGNRLAVSLGVGGSRVYDISTPATPTLLGSFPGSPYKLEAVDDRVFTIPIGVAGPWIQLIDFQTPASPVEVARIDFDSRTHEVSVGIDHVLVANDDGGVVMLDSTNPVAPTEVGRVDIGTNARKLAHVGGYGLASAGFNNLIRVIDPQASGPTLVATVDNLFPTNDLTVDGTRLYVASGSTGGLRIHDMSNPLLPQFLGSVVLAGEVVAQVAVSGNFAYTGWVNDTDLQVIDVSNPAAPVDAGSPYTLPDGVSDIVASGNWVFVATELFGVRILHNDGAGNLSEIADIDVSPAAVTGVALDGDFLYISAGVFSGLLVYDVSDPSDPQFVEQHNTAGEGNSVDAANGVIAMGEGNSGASTFGCDPAAGNQPPVTVGIIGNQSSDEGETIFPLSVHPNFNDPDGQALTFTATGLPPGLSLGSGSGVVNGTLGYDASGSYPVQITATDPFGLFVTQSFTWTIIETNAPPIVISAIPAQSNDEGESVNLDVFARFSDPDGDTLRFEAGGLPNGLSIDEASGVISGVLADDSSGSYTTLVLAFDPDEAAATQTFSWTVADTSTLLFRSGFE